MGLLPVCGSSWICNSGCERRLLSQAELRWDLTPNPETWNSGCRNPLRAGLTHGGKCDSGGRGFCRQALRFKVKVSWSRAVTALAAWSWWAQGGGPVGIQATGQEAASSLQQETFRWRLWNPGPRGRGFPAPFPGSSYSGQSGH